MAGTFDSHGERNSRDDQYALTLDVMHRIGVSVEELWVHYLSMGGDVDEYEVDAYFHGLMGLPAIERDLLSQAVNELLDDIGRGPRAPFSTGASGAGVRAGTHAGPCANGSRFAAVPWMTGGSELVSIVYSSVATQLFSERDLLELLRSSRQANYASELTGLLLYREGHFLQVLEGSEQSVRDRMRSIIADPRHTAVRILFEENRGQRQFPNLSMRFEPMSDTLLDEVPGFERTLSATGPDADPAGTVRVTKDLIRRIQRRS